MKTHETTELLSQDTQVLLGVLGDPQTDMRIGFDNGQWVLATGSGDSYEELVRNRKWYRFIKILRAEYSDQVKGVA